MKEEDKDLNYWKENAKDAYMITPLCVLRYITELEKAIDNNIVLPTTTYFHFDCWDKTGELQTKSIKATCKEHAILLFEKEFGETHNYDPPYN